jgi:predicted aspartyl protease
MATEVLVKEPGVGQVYCTIRVANGDDEVWSRDGTVRSVEVENVLMDTGASHLCLPEDTIAALGLVRFREVDVETPTGGFVLRLHRNLHVSYEDRECCAEVIELPTGARPRTASLRC